MKKFNTFLFAMAISFSTLLISCSDDTTSPPVDNGETIADEQNASEDANIPLNLLENGMSIPGANKITGTPPSPSGSLDFTLNKTETTGIQGTGFSIKFSSNDQIAGAYVRVNDADGNPTSSYFDIPSSSFGFKSGNKAALFSNNAKNTEAKVQVDDRSIDVNFNSTIPAGKFCYEICLYDENNNISVIETVCVVIESWGGNADLVGEWVLDRIEGEVGVIEQVDCQNGDQIAISDYSKEINREVVFSMSQDGSYNDRVDDEVAELDYDETVANCELVYFDSEVRSEERDGNWAYDEDDNELLIAVFKFRDLLDAGNNQEFDLGERVFDDLVVKEVTATELVIEERDQFLNDAITYYFKRK